MVNLLLIVVVLLLFVTLTLLLRGDRRFSPLEYYARGKEVGFTFSEARAIMEMCRIAGVPDSTAALWSIRELDACIKAFAKKYRAEGMERDRGAIVFMEKLYEFRKRLEFELPKYRAGITSSRFIRANQRIRVLVEGIGVYSSTVIDSNERYLVVSYPVGARVPPGFQWKGARVSVYFWRQEDAGYVFDTYVLEDLRIRDIPVLQLGHSGSLLRTQKRKSLRVRSRMPAYLYLLKRLEGAYEKPERVPGLKCVVQDVSEDGVSVLIGGKARIGLLVKAQFYIGDDQIVISGTVKGSEYDVEKNQSLLHVEAMTPSPRMRNVIRSHVYNVGPGDSERRGAELDERPFSV
ncbi:MAG TPA: PilZ domain-containing protein [Spirochaetales bacterium]|nr:PilZ domain-containing protein [Spirochaetales bacterium]HPM73999.1 PilZ domain-containing protein [Spirochaetales bacterium]